MAAKEMKLVLLMLALLVVSLVGFIRWIIKLLQPSSLEVDDVVEGRLGAAVETCEPVYGFLPCSNNISGLFFLIVVYEILLIIGGKYVEKGSEFFLQVIGDGLFGVSLFQVLGTIPQIVLVLVFSLSGTNEEAQRQATMGVGLVAGTTVMLLTLVWGISIVLGSYDFAKANRELNYGLQKCPEKGYGVVTDIETCYTARIMMISLIPFLFILLAKAFPPFGGKRFIYLIALIITFLLLIAYFCTQVFQPWIQYRKFESLVNTYAKDKLKELMSSNGVPDAKKIEQMFNEINVNNDSCVTASELRAFVSGVNTDDGNNIGDFSTLRKMQTALQYFDESRDGKIEKPEFVKKMMFLLTQQSKKRLDRITRVRGNRSQEETLEEPLLHKEETIEDKMPPKTWIDYFIATFYLVLGVSMLCALSTPLLKSTVKFAEVAHLSSFIVSYLAIPLTTNYIAAIHSISSSQEKTQESISLTLSTIYGGVFMNNIIGMIAYLAPVYARDLEADVFPQVVVVLIICTGMTMLASFRTILNRWMGFLIVSLYPISLAFIYISGHLGSGMGGYA